MQKAKIFIGPVGSGKTMAAREYAKKFDTKEVKSILSTGRKWRTPWATFDAKETTKLLIVDGILSAKGIENFYDAVAEGITVPKGRTKETVVINPEIILIFSSQITRHQLPDDERFNELFDVVQHPVPAENNDPNSEDYGLEAS